MPQATDLWFRKFLVAVPHNLLEEYFAKLVGPEGLPDVIALNEQVIQSILDDPRNAKLRTVVMDQFAQAHRLSHAEEEFLERICTEHEITLRRGAAQAEIAAFLLIQHPDVFRKALALYNCRTVSGAMSDYYVPLSDTGLIERHLAMFGKAVARRLKADDPHTACEISLQRDDRRFVIDVTTGENAKTIAHWRGRKLKIEAFRPARQDSLVYDADRNLLSIDAPVQRQLRNFYLQAFCEKIGGSEELASKALRKAQFTLDPILQGTFCTTGSETVQRVAVIEVTVLEIGEDEASITIRSDDAMSALRAKIDTGFLHPKHIESARIQFWSRLKGKAVHNIVTIKPPRSSDLGEKKLREVIIPYLKKHGIMMS